MGPRRLDTNRGERKGRAMRSQREAEEVMGRCDETIAEGDSKYHGMSYEEGVRDGIVWAFQLEHTEQPEDWPFTEET